MTLHFIYFIDLHMGKKTQLVCVLYNDKQLKVKKTEKQ